MKKIVLMSALFAAIASPALAATAHKHAQRSSAPEAYWIDSNTVVFAGDVLGRDPDPAVRMDLMRQGDAANVSGN